MSQLQNFSDPSAAIGGDLPMQEENWVNLLENLTVFISASSNLVHSLKQTIEVTKLQPNESLEEELLCACPKVCEHFYKKTFGEAPTSTANVSAIDPNATDVKSESSAGEPVICPAAEDPKSTQISNKTDLSKRIECVCKTFPSVSRASVKDSRSRGGRASKNASACEAFNKEKVQKLGKLREDIGCAQKNLSDILEQVRQLERLYQDYDSLNTPEGQVNTAALYKEIMKPQCVPYVSLPPMSPVSQSTQLPSGMIPCASLSRGETKKNPQEKVSILSAVPLEQVYYKS